MKELQIKNYVRYLFIVCILLFILNKLYLRPWILENDDTGILLILTNSIPNLLEAVIGTLILTGILYQIDKSFTKKKGPMNVIKVHLTAVVVASMYVLSQELKFHNLGGNNVYDPYDVIASFIGLIGTFMTIHLFGFVNKG